MSPPKVYSFIKIRNFTDYKKLHLFLSNFSDWVMLPRTFKLSGRTEY
jgi:hypothetical protein